MELLAVYDSSSSSSISLIEAHHHPILSSNCNHDAVFTCGAKDALHVDAPNHSSGVGADGYCSSSTAADDGRVGDSSRRNDNHHNGERFRNKCSGNIRRKIERNPDTDVGAKMDAEILQIEKKRKTQSIYTVKRGQKYRPRVVIAGCNHVPYGKSDSDISSSNLNQPKFERSCPHLEGRWAGHLHLPFPPLESLDLLDGIIDDASTNKNHAQREKNTMLNGQHPGNDCSIHETSSSEESSSEDEEDNMSQSRFLLPAARELIRYWARILADEANDSAADCDDEDAAKSEIVIIPHIPMYPIETKINSLSSRPPVEQPPSTKSLHISLARPIYLPSPSVDPFLADIEKSLNTIISISNGKNSTNQRKGRTLHLQPQNAAIFTNDQQTRSFLTIPVSNESARWVKQLLLPPIDSTMLRFGLETYYSTEDEGCILHVSVASVKGNIIPHMLQCRRQEASKDGIESNEGKSGNNVRSISLFSNHRIQNRDIHILECIPRYIPIRVDRLECEFGKAKQLAIPL